MVSIYDTIKPQQKGFAVNKPVVVFEKGRLIRRHNWTSEEEEYIRMEYRYTRESFCRLHREFGVTVDSLRKLLGRLGLVKYVKVWSPRELTFLRENYNKLPTVAIARKLKRSEGAIHQKVMKLKMSKSDRVEWFTMSETCRILGVSEQWLKRRLNNGYKFVVKLFNTGISSVERNNSPYYISRESLRNFIRRYPEELTGHNVDFVVLVEILAGIKTDMREFCAENAEEETEKEVV